LYRNSLVYSAKFMVAFECAKIRGFAERFLHKKPLRQISFESLLYLYL
jgi:hypothetical protein